MLTSTTRIDRGLECLDGSLESKPVRDERFQVNQSAFDETWWREGGDKVSCGFRNDGYRQSTHGSLSGTGLRNGTAL